MRKSHEIGRQSAALPPWVENIQSEIENFPYQPLRKSAHITVTEAAAHIGAGCTGAAFNVLPFSADELDDFAPMLQSIHTTRPFLDLLVRTIGREPLAGVCAGWNRDAMITGNLHEGRWLDSDHGDFSATYPAELYEIGIPPAYSMEAADVVMLKGDAVYAFSEEELKNILAGAVYMDGKCLANLRDIGMSGFTGFESGDTFDRDCIELFTPHRLNGEIKGRQRDVRQSFWREQAVEIIPHAKNAEILSSMVDYEGSQVAPACMGLFENSLGGRICVSGYAPWTFLQSGSKSYQMKSVFRWLSKDTLPAYIGSYNKICIWARRATGNSAKIVLLNASHDVAKDVHLKVLSDGSSACLTDVNLERQVIIPSGKDAGYSVFEIPRLNAWQIYLFEA